MDKSQILPNRKEYRATMSRFKHMRVINKTKTKGAFGKLSEYMMGIKKKRDLKKAEKMKLIETKQVTKPSSQPTVNKEVKKEVNE